MLILGLTELIVQWELYFPHFPPRNLLHISVHTALCCTGLDVLCLSVARRSLGSAAIKIPQQVAGRGGGRLSSRFLCNKQDGRSGPRAAGCHASRYSFVLSWGNEAVPHENLNFMWETCAGRKRSLLYQGFLLNSGGSWPVHMRVSLQRHR
jgi:hypothetical protein